MVTKHIALFETIIQSEITTVWNALTNPDMVNKYFFGSQLLTTWEPGTPIMFTGEWEGQPYCDKGQVIDYEHNKKLEFSYLSSWSQKEDIPENYLWVAYEVENLGDSTKLVIRQSNYSEELASHSKENWAQVVEAMRKIIE